MHLPANKDGKWNKIGEPGESYSGLAAITVKLDHRRLAKCIYVVFHVCLYRVIMIVTNIVQNVCSDCKEPFYIADDEFECNIHVT